jgi:hypothetical protein
MKRNVLVSLILIFASVLSAACSNQEQIQSKSTSRNQIQTKFANEDLIRTQSTDEVRILATDNNTPLMEAGSVFNFGFTGAPQTWVVPAGVTKIKIETYGAQGGAISGYSYGQGGLGGYASGELAVNQGDVLNIYVGGRGGNSPSSSIDGFNRVNTNGGWNGGGNGSGSRGAGGGGSSDVRIGGTTFNQRIIVAGGGGGGFVDTNSHGGNNTSLYVPFYGENGDISRHSYYYPNDEGGGGGGYYGGRTHHGDDPSSGYGGSSYVGGVTNGVQTKGVRTGNGEVKITILELDNTPPNPPVVNQLKDTDRVIEGKAEPSSKVTVKQGEKVLGNTITAPDGTFIMIIPLQSAGTVLTVTATDAIGNESTPTSVTVIWYDRVAPETTYRFNSVEAVNGWYSSDVQITLVGRDRESGVEKTEYRISGGEWRQYTEPFVITNEGKHTIEYRSIDKAGNEEEVKSIEAKIDKTAPTMNLTLNEDSLLPANNKMIPITVNADANDAGSTIKSVILTSIESNEPDDEKGAGNDDADIQEANVGTEDYQFNLRAERLGKGEGRIYTITYTATDVAGNSITKSAIVVVPHESKDKQ